MKLAEVFALIAGERPDLEFTAFDGSRSGNPDADVRIELRSERAVQYLASAPGELGLARAYLAGEIEIYGSLHDTLTRLGDVTLRKFTKAEKLQIARTLAAYRRFKIAPPPEEVRLAGDRHTKRRDAASISHHYDVSNRFYAWVLGPSMAYTCAVYPRVDATLEEAQAEKFDLVCRKLDLRPGQRLLDVGCGWGGMVRHAVENYGVRAIGVTLSQQQAIWGQQLIESRGLQERAEIRHGDYRDIAETDFDAVSSIGLTEHIGKTNYPAYFAFLRARLRPAGRLLNHSITRANDVGETLFPNGFINRYVFPDHEQSGFRRPPRGEPSRALRGDTCGLVGKPRRSLGRSNRRGRTGQGQGVAAVSRGKPSCVRAEPDPTAPVPCGQHRFQWQECHAASTDLGAEPTSRQLTDVPRAAQRAST
jgi:cyclopropane-fatty-acyl-phospholipid synthase